MTTQLEQPEALRLAEHLEWADARDLSSLTLRIKSAAELRRLHALNQELLEFLKEYVEAWHDGMADDSYLLRKAIEAITKAEGEKQ